MVLTILLDGGVYDHKLWRQPRRWVHLARVNKSTLQKKFGEIIRERRKAAGLTQEDLADRAGIHQTYLSILECGKRSPTIEVLRLLAKGLATTMTDIVSELEGLSKEG